MCSSSDDVPSSDGFVYELCKAEESFRLLFLFSVAGVGIMLIWLLMAFMAPSLNVIDGTTVVATMTLVLAGGFALLSGFFLRHCADRKRKRREAYSEDARKR